MIVRLVAALPVIALVLAVLGTLPAQAQESAAEGALYFTPRFIADPFTGASGVGTPVAGTRVHAFSVDAPTSATAQKVYLQTSMYAQTYATEFVHTFAEATELSGVFKAKIWLSCDHVAPFRPGYDTGGVNDLHGYRLEIRKGQASTATPLAQSRVFTAIPTCTGPATVTELSPQATFSAPVEFKSGEIIGVRILVWTLTGHESILKNVHFLVNSTSRSALLTGVGLPQGAGGSSSLPELAVDPVKDTLEAAPGQKVRTNLTISNPSKSAVNVSINATGDYTAEPIEATVSVPAEGSVNATVEIAVPETATAGQTGAVVFHVGIEGTELANATVNVNVIEPNPTTGPGASPTTGTLGTQATNETGSAKNDKGNDTPGPAFAALVMASAMAMTLLRRRRQI